MMRSTLQIDRMKRAVIRRMLSVEHIPATKVARFFACSKRNVHRIATNEKGDDVQEDAKWLEEWDKFVTDVDAHNSSAAFPSSGQGTDSSSRLQDESKHGVTDDDEDDGGEFRPSADPDNDSDGQKPRITDAAILSGWSLRRSARLRHIPAPGVSRIQRAKLFCILTGASQRSRMTLTLIMGTSVAKL